MPSIAAIQRPALQPGPMWHGIKSLTDYKSSNTYPTSAAHSSLPHDLNHFFAWFNRDRSHQFPKLSLQKAPSHALVLSTHERKQVPSHINPYKAAGPEGVPGQVLDRNTAQNSWRPSSLTCLTSPWSRPLSPPASNQPQSALSQIRQWSGT